MGHAMGHAIKDWGVNAAILFLLGQKCLQSKPNAKKGVSQKTLEWEILFNSSTYMKTASFSTTKAGVAK